MLALSIDGTDYALDTSAAYTAGSPVKLDVLNPRDMSQEFRFVVAPTSTSPAQQIAPVAAPGLRLTDLNGALVLAEASLMGANQLWSLVESGTGTVRLTGKSGRAVSAGPSLALLVGPDTPAEFTKIQAK